MDNTTIYSRKNLAPLIFEAFSYLQEKGLVVTLFRYASETVPNSGKEDERLVRLDDGSGHKLTGLFLKASKESMLERNARRAPRWFESPFIINGQEYYLSSQWNASGDFQLTLPNLNYFLKECCRNESDGSTFSIYKSDDEFIFAQGKFEDNNEVLPQKSPDSKEYEIKQKPVLEEKVLPHQKIFFGAPGTGKSFKVNEAVQNQQVFRTTFHPDYDYAQFVGAYKPKKDGNAITYSFVPQVFAKAYAAAWKLYLDAKGDSRLRGNDDKNGENDSGKDIQVYLVIEEINRGNCAQIFGDIFQLLDRDSEGFSQYSIDADCDFATWLKEDSILKTVWSEYETKVGDGKLKLPPNLNILATMNTSDQSLFPMDSAFKRRFDWEYVPINYEKAEADFIVGDASFNFKWLDFLKKVNADIYRVTQSEDKQMGEFFIKPKNKDYVTLDEFRSKVLFYLWDSVYKDELDSKLVFHFAYLEKGPDVTFQRLFNSDFVEILKKMLANLDNEYKDGAQILISSGANP